MKLLKNRSLIESQRGVILLEGLIAILIFSVGILGAVGLQATMIKNTADAKYRSMAGYLAQQRVGQMWVNQGILGANLANFIEINTDIAASSGLPTGLRTTARCTAVDWVSPTDLSCFVITVTWQQPGHDVHNVRTVARVAGG